MFRFIHTSDLYLDAPLQSLALKDPDLFELVGTATRLVLERIVDICIRANQKISVRRTLHRYKCPLDKALEVVQLILKQAEAPSHSWTGEVK